MFQQLVNSWGGGRMAAEMVLTARPSQIAEYLEQCWLVRDQGMFVGLPPAPVQPPGPQVPPNPADNQVLIAGARPNLIDVPLPVGPFAPPPPDFVWPHLAYAFMLEQTRLVVVLRRVLEGYVTGALSIASPETRDWVRATEELLFAAPRAPSVYSLESHLRSDTGARRRNAYFRLLGMDLSHGSEEGKPYPFVKPVASNRDLATVFETLLIEVWKAYINITNVAGPNTTDDTAIADLLRRLYDMLTSRRLNGALAREEFEAVAALSWLNLTITYDTQITADLQATGGSALERLMKIAQRVGVSLHSRADSYFQMAHPMSNILRGIESGALTGVPGAQALYLIPAFVQDMLALITHWSIASGRDLKDPAVRQPLSAILARTASAPSGNGASSRLPAGVI